MLEPIRDAIGKPIVERRERGVEHAADYDPEALSEVPRAQRARPQPGAQGY